MSDSQPLPEQRRPDWTDRAACRKTVAPWLWFSNDVDAQAAAKAVCRDCGVRPECLACALEHRIEHGIWSGLNEAERRQLRSRAS